MMTSMPPDQLFDRPRQRERFAKGRGPAHLHNQARDPARGRFLPEFTKQASQFLFAVLVYNLGSSQPGPRIHAHVERTVSNEAETALSIFELAGRNTKVKENAADGGNAKLVENAGCMPKIRLAHDEAPAEMCQSLANMPDCIRILIEPQDVGATLQKRFGVTATAARSVYDEKTGFRF
jgi:hypothetical protein